MLVDAFQHTLEKTETMRLLALLNRTGYADHTGLGRASSS